MKELDRFRKFLAEGKKSTSGGMLLSENAPGYDTRKFGNPLPTLESVQAAHEAKKDEEDEVRDGVKSAAEKLGMKPSHIKEVDSFDFTIYGPMYDFATGEEMGTDPQEINYEATLDMGSEEEMIALAKQYAANSPKEKFIVTHTDDPWNEVWSTDAESMDKKERREDRDDLAEESFGAAGTDKRSGQVIGDILQLIRDTGIDPADVLEEIGQEFGIAFEFGRGQ